MTSDRIRKAFVLFFVLGFFTYLFGPLIVMGITAFNSSGFPRVAPWECFTAEWFGVLARDTRLIDGLRNSFLIGLGVVILAVPLGLCGALMLMQVREPLRPWYYTIVISPILVPGVVLGISTLLFWDRIGHMFGASRTSLFYDGFFLTIIGQSTFIAAYTMLVFIARLQRFDRAQEEAALDLGATHVQTFRKVVLPFLKPAIASAAVLAFLASFENYNTTVFTIVSESTLTTVLASKVRYGINPSISSLAVIIVAVTLFGAALHEIYKRRESAALAESGRIARGMQEFRKKRNPFLLDPSVILIFLVTIAGLGTVYFGGTVGVDQCKAEYKEAKQKVIQERIRTRQQAAMFQDAAPTTTGTGAEKPKTRAKGTENFNSIFSPDNLNDQSDSEGSLEESRTGTENFNNIFNPDNLKDQSDSTR